MSILGSDYLLAEVIIPQPPQYMQEGTHLFSHTEAGEDAGDDFLPGGAARQLPDGIQSLFREKFLPSEGRRALRAGVYSFLANPVRFWYNGPAALLQTGSREEVNAVEILISFFVSVGASIVGSYISKWLNRHGKGR